MNNARAPKVEAGRYYLEDHTGQVLLDLSRASLLTDGFVTENSIVLVQGEAIDGVLHAHHLGEPPRPAHVHSLNILLSISYMLTYLTIFAFSLRCLCE